MLVVLYKSVSVFTGYIVVCNDTEAAKTRSYGFKQTENGILELLFGGQIIYWSAGLYVFIRLFSRALSYESIRRLRISVLYRHTHLNEMSNGWLLGGILST